MLFALIVVVLVAAGLLAALLLTRSSAAEFRSQADGRESALIAERDRLTDDGERLRNDLGATRAEIGQLNTEAAAQGQELRRVSGELDKARMVGAEQAARIEYQSREIAALVTDNNTLQDRVDAANAARIVAEEEAAAEKARDTGVVIGDVASVDTAHPQALWDLEVSRSERTWRTSVATNPMAPVGPFADTDDPVRLAVEIEAAALRENVGAFITIEWKASPIEEPARRHLVVRVAQEMLESAARNPEPLRLVATGDDEVRLTLVADDDDNNDFVSVVPPTIENELVDVRDDSGLSVTVKAE